MWQTHWRLPAWTARLRWSESGQGWSTETTSVGALVLWATVTRVARSTGAPTPQSRVRGLHHSYPIDAFPAMVPDHFQLYKRILRASSNTRVRILNACVATVTAGWCPT